MPTALYVAFLLVQAPVGSTNAPKPPPAYPPQEAMNAYVNCLVKAAAEMDDHRSDAGTIANSIRHICYLEGLAYQAAEVREAEKVIHNSSVAEAEAEVFEAKSRDFAIGAVLLERKAARPNSN